MNDRRADFEALRAFARQGDQQAFGELARRHLDLVYAIALRKVSDPGAAQEISQTVFATLARKAWTFGPDDSLPAWLHRTTLLEAKHWWRGELRRRRREETAAQLGTTMKTPDDQPALHALVPLLDEALLSLREKDRTALLLRYYESRSLRDVGESLGVREDAAQKRVAGALEQLSRFFQRQGYKTATVAAAAAALQGTASAAPAAVAAAVVQTALQTAPPVLGAFAVLARLASLSKLQAATACLAVVAVPAIWQWNEIQTTQAQIVSVRKELVTTRTYQHDLNIKVQNLRPEIARLQAALADTDQTEARRAEFQRRLLALKERIRNLLTDPDYHWPADLPFVRIPKSALTSMSYDGPLSSSGIIRTEARELLGLTPEERQSIEDTAARYLGLLDENINARIYETNRGNMMSWIPTNARVSTVFVVPPLGEEIGQAAGRMLDDVAATLGPERSRLFGKGTNNYGMDSMGQLLGFNAGNHTQEITVWIREVDAQNNLLNVGYGWTGGFGSSGRSDSMGFSDNFDFSRDPGAPDSFQARFDRINHRSFPESIMSRMRQWYTEQARNLSPTPAQP